MVPFFLRGIFSRIFHTKGVDGLAMVPAADSPYNRSRIGALIPFTLLFVISAFNIAIILVVSLPAATPGTVDIPAPVPASTPTPMPTPAPTPVPEKGGVALTFDDKYVDDWYVLRDLLKEYGAKVTFFIASPDLLTRDQIEMLKVLQSDGHEIACHGWRHIDAVEYTRMHSVNNYLDIEVLPAISQMQSWGITPASFAYPYGNGNSQLDGALLGYFGHLRTLVWPRDGLQIKDLDSAYYKFDGQAVLGGVVMDNIDSNPLSQFYDGMDRARANDEVLVLVGHDTLESTKPDYITPPSKLQAIIRYASQNNLTFYTMSQLAPTGTA